MNTRVAQWVEHVPHLRVVGSWVRVPSWVTFSVSVFSDLLSHFPLTWLRPWTKTGGVHYIWWAHPAAMTPDARARDMHSEFNDRFLYDAPLFMSGSSSSDSDDEYINGQYAVEWSLDPGDAY